jgi:hypothetical protein
MHTLNPMFALNRFPFENVGVRSVLRVLVYDRRSALDSRLLGVATLPAAAIPASSGPIYMWLPMAPPSRRGRSKLARLQVGGGGLRQVVCVGQRLAVLWQDDRVDAAVYRWL